MKLLTSEFEILKIKNKSRVIKIKEVKLLFPALMKWQTIYFCIQEIGNSA